MSARMSTTEREDYLRRAADANRRARARRKAVERAEAGRRRLDAAIHADVTAHLAPGATDDQRANLHVLARAVRTEIHS